MNKDQLSKEREQEIRGFAIHGAVGSQWYWATQDLLAEIDRLRKREAEVVAVLEQLELLADDATGLELIRQTLRKLQ